MAVIYNENASSRIRVFDADGKHGHDVPLPAIGTVTGFNGRWAGDEAFYSYTSFHVPFLVQQYSVSRGEQEMWGQVKVPIHAEKIEVKQVWFASKDGTRVPMFLLGQKGMKLDGARPTLADRVWRALTLSIPPTSPPWAALWVENGGVFADANLRGGGEFGEAWHRAGMMEKKQNVFDDFTCRRRVADREPLHQSFPTGHHGKQQRRIAGGRGAYPAPRPLPRRGLHASRCWTCCAIEKFMESAILGFRVRLGRKPGSSSSISPPIRPTRT